MPSNLFVVLMGVGTVFVGLICIILLVTLMGWICRKLEKKPVPEAPAAQIAAPTRQAANGGELLAAISAAVAEELGTDVSAFRIVSVKKL